MSTTLGNWTDSSKFEGFLPEQAWKATRLALDTGMRHFDGAHVYGTERHVGDIIGERMAKGELNRDDIFLTSKFCHPRPPSHMNISHLRSWDMRDHSDNTRQKILDDFQRSLDDMGVGYFDLILMHWPGTFGETDAEFAKKKRIEAWKTFEEIYKKGGARAIGVANYSIQHLEEIIEGCDVIPMVNQIETNPLCQDRSLIQFCQSNNIIIEAYAPFGSGTTGVLQNETIKSIAKKINRGTGQVILRWMVQQGMVVLPKSTNPVRIKQNMSLFDFELSEEDMACITALQGENDVCSRTCPAPDSIL